MDTGEGKFEHFYANDEEDMKKKLLELYKDHPKHGGVFRVGEELEIRGSRFRIKKITAHGMKLKLLKK